MSIAPLDAKTISRLRESSGLTQSEFWARLGMTQGAGSRYEHGRHVNNPLRILLALTYGGIEQRRQAIEQLGLERFVRTQPRKK